ncbi:MAG: cation/multidrug efflux pump [Gammaproteobacteria bacterium]|nr:cation/multidrug efflux pump [Gammaproteobacteria bacterium]
MNTLIAITTAFTLVAVFFVLSMFRHLRRRRVIRASGSFAGGVATASVGGFGMLLLTSIYSYAQLTGEQAIGSIEFTKNAPGDYTARLMVNGETDRLLPMLGDEWQIDARVVTWKPPVTILGLDPIYQLERLSGRYADIGREVSEQRTVHALANDNPLDVWHIARKFPILLPGVDAYYGTATYVPMADGARFEVSLSRDALIARPQNDAARKAVGEWQQNGT